MIGHMKLCKTCKFWLRDDDAKRAGGKKGAVGTCLLAVAGAARTPDDYTCPEWHAKS